MLKFHRFKSKKVQAWKFQVFKKILLKILKNFHHKTVFLVKLMMLLLDKVQFRKTKKLRLKKYL
jgi:hypothetical protein